MTEKYIQKHKDGSIWATGFYSDGQMDGYWEWFRKDGTKLRSGHFNNGVAVGEWTTYDAKGQVYKVTTATESEEGDLPTSIGKPAMGALHLEGIFWLKDVAKKTDEELLELHGVGPKEVRILREKLSGL